MWSRNGAVLVWLLAAATCQSQKTGVCPSPCQACPKCPNCPSTPPARPPVCPPPAPKIPPGYEHFAGHGYYKIHSTPLDWYAAKATCEREGAHLAILNSKAENDIFIKLAARYPNKGIILLGFHDLSTEGQFVTVLGQSLTNIGYAPWNKGQPDNFNKVEHCGSMFPTGNINDYPCTSKEHFICELS